MNKKIRPTCDQCLYNKHCYDLLDASDCADYTEDFIQELSQWVYNNYKINATGWTWERSEGNCTDCFYDGQNCGRSWAAYEVGRILGIDLPEPEWEEDNE